MQYPSTEISNNLLPIEEFPCLKFNNVTFGYNERKLLLQNANFNFKYGKCYAIIEKTGIGKSTIFDLLTGLYPPYSGNILLGNLILDNNSIYTFRHYISVFFQFPFLMNNTIEQNIKINNPDINNEDLNIILKITQVDIIINKLPNGIKSNVGINGVQLSGGERKRIQIAQSLIKDAKIYLFDELTSSLDQKTAKVMMLDIKKYLKNKTVIFIEHRLNMIEDVDIIYEFKNKSLLPIQLDSNINNKREANNN